MVERHVTDMELGAVFDRLGGEEKKRTLLDLFARVSQTQGEQEARRVVQAVLPASRPTGVPVEEKEEGTFPAFLTRADHILVRPKRSMLLDPSIVAFIFDQVVTDVSSGRWTHAKRQDVIIELTALRLQTIHGDFMDHLHTRNWLMPQLEGLLPRELLLVEMNKREIDEEIVGKSAVKILGKWWDSPPYSSDYTKTGVQRQYLALLTEWNFFDSCHFGIAQRQLQHLPNNLRLRLTVEGVALFGDTQLSHCCYTVVTLLLHCCYTVVTPLLHSCHTQELMLARMSSKSIDFPPCPVRLREKTGGLTSLCTLLGRNSFSVILLSYCCCFHTAVVLLLHCNHIVVAGLGDIVQPRKVMFKTDFGAGADRLLTALQHHGRHSGTP
jgi:hypothetical protein